jgi:growth hormone secretagogue receptor
MSSTDVTINQLNQAAVVIFIALSIINFALGSVGLILNILVFTRSTLRREPCSFYFLSVTCYDLFVVFLIMPVRILSNVYNINEANYNLGLCKVESFAFYVTRVISIWLIVMACVDRYLHSSWNERIRRMSSLKSAKISSAIISIIILISYSHMLVYYEIINVSNQFGNITPQCNSQKGIYRTFLGFWHMVMSSLCPSFIMLLFGFLTLKNVRQRRQLVQRVGENRAIRRTDTQLLRMLAAQVFVIIIATLPFCVDQLYTSFTSSLKKSTLRIAQENLAGQITAIVTYFVHSSSFYLYTLAGTIFRKEVLKIFGRCRPGHQNRVHTMDGSQHQISTLQTIRQIPTTNTAPTRQ